MLSLSNLIPNVRFPTQQTLNSWPTFHAVRTPTMYLCLSAVSKLGLALTRQCFCLCAPWARDWEAERENEERERKREKEGGEKEREERRERTPPEDLPPFRAKLLLLFFTRENKPLSRQLWQCANLHWRLHAYATVTIMAPSLRQTLNCRSHVRLLLPFFYGCLLASNQALPALDTSHATCCYWRRLLGKGPGVY